MHSQEQSEESVNTFRGIPGIKKSVLFLKKKKISPTVYSLSDGIFSKI